MSQKLSKIPKKEKKMSTARRLVTFYEAAERLGVSYWLLWRGAEAGFFKTIYLGSRRMIPESEVARIEEFGFGNGRSGRPRKESPKQAEAR